MALRIKWWIVGHVEGVRNSVALPEPQAALPKPRRLLAIGEVIVAAGIWSTSFVGIRYVVGSAPPLTLAGLRYSIAFLLFLPFLVRHRGSLRSLRRGLWTRFALMGLVQYTLGNGALFWALRWVSSTSGSLTQSLAPLVTLALELLWLKERLSIRQLSGVLVAVSGSVFFFGPEAASGAHLTGLALLGITVVAFGLFPVLVRETTRSSEAGSIVLTALPLGFGGGALLILGLIFQGWARLSCAEWGIVLGLAAVNTTVAYLLFTHALRGLRATEANVILNLSPLGTALIAWATLGEGVSVAQGLAMAAVVSGAALAQWRRGVEPSKRGR